MIPTPVENGEPDEILTIVELESAINYFNRLSPPRAGIITSPEVRKLANLYGAMVYERKDSATLSSLDEIQHAAILAHRHAMSENPNPNSLAE